MKRSCMSFALLLCITGCGQVASDGVAPQVNATAPLNADQQQQQAVALAARDALFQQLLGKLMETMSSSGPAAAIDVCREQAPAIAAEVGQEFGVTIGRTSHRLRNPKNEPPDWAQSFVDDLAADAQFVPLADDSLGVLLPIRLKPQCLMCHGPQEQILPEVREALTRSYPDDQATGFQDGDLRGWFWVTVPVDARLPLEHELPVQSETSLPSTDTDTSPQG